MLLPSKLGHKTSGDTESSSLTPMCSTTGSGCRDSNKHAELDSLAEDIDHNSLEWRPVQKQLKNYWSPFSHSTHLTYGVKILPTPTLFKNLLTLMTPLDPPGQTQWPMSDKNWRRQVGSRHDGRTSKLTCRKGSTVINVLHTSNSLNGKPHLSSWWRCPHWKPCVSALGIAIGYEVSAYLTSQRGVGPHGKVYRNPVTLDTHS